MTETGTPRPISAAMRRCLETGAIDEDALRRAVNAQYPPHVGVMDHATWATGLQIHHGRHPAHPQSRGYWVCQDNYQLGSSVVHVWIDLPAS